MTRERATAMCWALRPFHVLWRAAWGHFQPPSPPLGAFVDSNAMQEMERCSNCQSNIVFTAQRSGV